MKIFIIFFISIFFIHKNIYASEYIYGSNFFDININSKNISEEKIKQIEYLKVISLLEILKRILTNQNLIQLKKKIILKKEVNYLIKNINIENEFISLNKYSANVKINFDKEKIINLLQLNEINYTDLESKKLLFVASENNQISKEGLSNNNSFYQSMFLKKKGLLNFLYPDLSPNDRFILPYEKIENINLHNLDKISKKYKVDFIIIINLYKNANINYVNLHFYSFETKKIERAYKFNLDINISYENQLIKAIDEWWKSRNIIDFGIINQNFCTIKNSNIHELYFIISQLNKISQIKSIKLLKINLGKNLYKIIYYGDVVNLSLKLANFNIVNGYDSKNQCMLFLKS